MTEKQPSSPTAARLMAKMARTNRPQLTAAQRAELAAKKKGNDNASKAHRSSGR